MITIENDFLTDITFAKLQKYCNQPFLEQKVGENVYSILPVPEEYIGDLEIEGYDIITTFIRRANSEYDTKVNIHADGIVFGKRSHLASVLYINQQENCVNNGTAFYKHRDYGESLPDDVDDSVFDEVLLDRENVIDFRPTISVGSRPNRMLTYPSNFFHGKYPSVIGHGERIVLVTFYTKKDED